MVGIVIFFLVSTLLGLGMMFSLLLVSPLYLNERFFRFNGTLSLTLIAMGQAVFYLYGRAGGSTAEHMASWSRLLDSANPWLWSSGGLLLAYLLILPSRRILWLRVLLGAASLGGAAALVRIGTGLGSLAVRPSVGGLVLTLDFFLSSLALGSVMTCMILGHWYLVEPGMSVRHLKALAALFIGSVGARFALGSYTAMLLWRDISASGEDLLSNLALANLLFLAQRVLFGLVLPLALSWMIWQTVKIRSTQSATGILYVAVVFVLFGEFLSHYILVATGYPI